MDTDDDSQDSEGSEGTLQLCMWDVYHIFLIALLVFTRLLLEYIYHRITNLLIDDVMLILVCLPDDLILGFCCSNLNWETSENHIDYHPCIKSKPINQG